MLRKYVGNVSDAAKNSYATTDEARAGAPP